MSLLTLTSLLLLQAPEAGGVDPIGALAGFGAVVLTGLLKRGVGKLDARATELVKPVQPWIALGASVLLPLAARQLGLEVDPQAFVQAPASTLAFIGAREVFARLKPIRP